MNIEAYKEFEYRLTPRFLNESHVAYFNDGKPYIKNAIVNNLDLDGFCDFQFISCSITTSKISESSISNGRIFDSCLRECEMSNIDSITHTVSFNCHIKNSLDGYVAHENNLFVNCKNEIKTKHTYFKNCIFVKLESSRNPLYKCIVLEQSNMYEIQTNNEVYSMKFDSLELYSRNIMITLYGIKPQIFLIEL